MHEEASVIGGRTIFGVNSFQIDLELRFFHIEILQRITVALKKSYFSYIRRFLLSNLTTDFLYLVFDMLSFHNIL